MSEGFYRAFEEKHRGSRELIKTRLQVYAPFVEPLKQIYESLQTIDLGCGRGEWLELLTQWGFDAHGVDIDDEMLGPSRELGLKVQLKDALDALHGLDDESQVVVSGFHIAEHIPFIDLQTLVQEALRVLKPGGLLILETPNPENILVGTTNFYLDPTHIRPIPPLLLSFLPEYYGFERVKILRLQEALDIQGAASTSLIDVLTGVSPDYSIVAQKSIAQEQLKMFAEPFSVEYGVTLNSLSEKYDQTNRKNPIALESVAQNESRVLLQKLAQREQDFAQQLQKLQKETQNDLKQHLKAQSELRLQVDAARSEHSRLQNAQQALTVEHANAHKRAIQQLQLQIEQKLADHSRIEREQRATVNALVQKHDKTVYELELTTARVIAKRDQEIERQKQLTQNEVQRLALTWAEKEKSLMLQANQIAQQASADKEKLLNVQILREQDFAKQLLATQNQATTYANTLAAKQSAEQARQYLAQIEQLRQGHAEQLKTLSQQYQDALTDKLNDYQRLIENHTAQQTRLQMELLAEQEGALRLEKTLAAVQQTLVTKQNSFFGRITAPLRALASITSAQHDSASFLMHTNTAQALLSSSLYKATLMTPPTVATTLGELLSCHDQRFVHCAYLTLLGRAPDHEGLSYYLGRLRMGYSKITILAQLCLSAEGKTHAVKLLGLDSAIQRYKRGRWPLIGRYLQSTSGTDNDHPATRNLRSMGNQLALLRDESTHRFNQVDLALVGMHRLLASSSAASTSIEEEMPPALQLLSTRAQDIYFKLKAATFSTPNRASK